MIHTYKNLLATFICCIALVGFLIMLLAFRSSAGAMSPDVSVTIDVDANPFAGFSDVHTTDTRVLATGWVTVNLQATGLDDYNAASLRVYTANASGDLGMEGQTIPTHTVPFKVWTPNFGAGMDGDGDGVPDVDNDRNWRDDAYSVWAYVFDQAIPVSETVPPWNYPLFNATDLFKWSDAHSNPDLHLPSWLDLSQPVRFALVLDRPAAPQVYSTQVYFEFALSDDFGDTFITYTEAMLLSVVVHDASPIVNLSVDTSGFTAFSNPGPWPQRVLASGHATLTLSAYGLYPYDAATIRIYTNNDPQDSSKDHLGMTGDLDRDWTVPVKVWTPNFGMGTAGDGDSIPGIDNDVDWREVWVYVFDWNHPITETWWHELPESDPYYDPNCAWCYPLFNYTDLFKWSDYHHRQDQYGDFVYHLPGYLEMIDRRPKWGQDYRVPVYFAADFTDALPQTYSTTLHIEFAFSSDKGDTVAQNVVVPIGIAATVPGDASSVDWLLNRVAMRPDMDATNDSVEKLADSQQETLDWSDGGWTYDQALTVIALTAAGHFEEARQVLNGLQYLQNDDGSWFFSYMTTATDERIEEWAATDEVTLYNGNTCLTETLTITNGYPDELEKRACWDVTHDLPLDQIGPWILEDHASTESPQTQTLLSDTIKYRTYDFRKYAGTNAWVVMAANFYEAQTRDSSYRQMATGALEWLELYRDTEQNSPTGGGIAMGRVWSQTDVTATVTTTYGFVDRPIYVAEHNFDAYSAFRSMGWLTGDDTYTQTAELIMDFLLRELWAPHVITTTHAELDGVEIDNFFFPGIDMSDPITTPQGIIDACIYLDGQTWSNLALGPETEVQAKDGLTATLAIALAFPDRTMLSTNTTIFSGTGYMVTGIDGYKENTCSPQHSDFVWSEGSEGMVAARYLAGGPGDTAAADYYHAETASYMMDNGGVPYSTLPVNPSVPLWNWTDANSIAGTAWFYFNERSPRVNPFQPWALSPVQCVYLPMVMKLSP